MRISILFACLAVATAIDGPASPTDQLINQLTQSVKEAKENLNTNTNDFCQANADSCQENISKNIDLISNHAERMTTAQGNIEDEKSTRDTQKSKNDLNTDNFGKESKKFRKKSKEMAENTDKREKEIHSIREAQGAVRKIVEHIQSQTSTVDTDRVAEDHGGKRAGAMKTVMAELNKLEDKISGDLRTREKELSDETKAHKQSLNAIAKARDTAEANMDDSAAALKDARANLNAEQGQAQEAQTMVMESNDALNSEFAKCKENKAEWGRMKEQAQEELTELTTVLKTMQDLKDKKFFEQLGVEFIQLESVEVPEYKHFGVPKMPEQTTSFVQIQKARLAASTPSDAVKALMQTADKFHLADLKALGNQLALAQQSTGADPFAKIKGLIREMISTLTEKNAADSDTLQKCNNKFAEYQNQRNKFTTNRDREENEYMKLSKFINEMDANRASAHNAKVDAEEAKATAKKIFEKQEGEHKETERATKRGISGMDKLLEKLSALFSAKANKHQSSQGASDQILGLVEMIRDEFKAALKQSTARQDAADKLWLEQQTKYDSLIAKYSANLDNLQKELGEAEGSATSARDSMQAAQDSLSTTETEWQNTIDTECKTTGTSFAERMAAMDAEIAALRDALEILKKY